MGAAFDAGGEAAQADYDSGRLTYDPVRCLLAADKWARERMLAEDVKPSEAKGWMQDWIIGYASFYEELPS